eukprot:m.256707 g.256707  ORF g.256707 m.256707 type:complete len:60 (+) comp40402_c1_seq24:397-576(+)
MRLCDSRVCWVFLYWDNRVIDAHEFSAFGDMRYEVTTQFTMWERLGILVWTMKAIPFNG